MLLRVSAYSYVCLPILACVSLFLRVSPYSYVCLLILTRCYFCLLVSIHSYSFLPIPARAYSFFPASTHAYPFVSISTRLCTQNTLLLHVLKISNVLCKPLTHINSHHSLVKGLRCMNSTASLAANKHLPY
jgi:hypothetical protein